MQKLELSSPWQIHRQKLAAVFEYDEQVTVGPVESEEAGPVVVVRVANHAKADALRELLACPDFGNVHLTVRVEDTAEAEATTADLLRDAFAYNRLFRGVEVVEDPTGTDWTYLVAWPDAVQFPADNLEDYRGNKTMLAETAAKDILNIEAGVAVCTADLRED